MPPQRKEDRHVVPHLLGLYYKDAQNALIRADYQISQLKGSKTTNKKLIFHVQGQSPLPNEPLPKRQKVTLRLYIDGNTTARKSNGPSRK